MKDRAGRYQRATEVRAALETVQGAVLQSRRPSEETRGPRTLVLRGMEHLQVKNGDVLLLVGTNKGAFFYAHPATARNGTSRDRIFMAKASMRWPMTDEAAGTVCGFQRTT